MAITKKVAIVTGAGKGIGAGIAIYFLSKGWHVVIAEIDQTRAHAFSEDDSRLLFVETDVKEESSVKKMIERAMDHFGRIDALVNNAGIAQMSYTPLEKTTLKAFKQIIDTNLTGAFLCAKYATPHLRKQSGSIVNIASTRAFQSEPHTEAYSASKGGLYSLTHAMAISLGPDIRVNCVSPGWIHTHDNQPLKPSDHAQHPAGRVGTVEDIAAMVFFLLSDEARFITAQNFIVDGGMTKKMIYLE
jgi:NAD(P)-dependent dehydrogenase (short-subunit alcohol dehydrogenase family)